MKKTIFLIFLLCTGVFAQHKYELSGVPGYSVRFEVSDCERDYCSGDLKVRLSKKGSKAVFQEFRLQTDFSFWGDAPQTLSVIPYDKQGLISFEDYNFDGIDDLAIQNGRDAAYGEGSYNIYIFSPRTGKFVYDKRFSALATGPYTGMFSVNKKKRALENSSKSGCCWHEEVEFKIINNRPVKSYQRTEDAFSNDKWVIITTGRLVKGRWRQTVEKKSQ